MHERLKKGISGLEATLGASQDILGAKNGTNSIQAKWLRSLECEQHSKTFMEKLVAVVGVEPTTPRI